LKHCVFVHDYLNALNELEIKDTKVEKIKEEFSTYSYKLYQAFTKEFWKLKDYNESEKKKKELLISYVKDYSFEDYIKLFDDYAYVKKQITNKDWNITESLRIVLRHIFETEFNLFYELIKYLIQRKNFILLQSYFFISDMLSKDDIAMSEFYDLLKNNEYKLQEEWMISFFQFLPEEKITEFYYEELIDLLKSFDKFYLDLRLDFLEKYKQFDKNIYINVIKILYKKVKSGITNVNFHLLFNPNSEIFRKLDEIFNSDLTLFKEIYFYQKSKDIYSDHNSNVLKKILEQDSDFIIEYLDWMHEKKEHLTDMNDHSNYGSLWKATNYVEIFDKILNYLRNKFDFLFSSHHYINVFFLKHENDGISVRLDYLKRKFKESITDIKMIKLLFVIITNYFPTERLHFISVFTKHNPDIEIFKQLYLESDSQSGTATFVPVYTKRMEFWKLVQDSFSSVELLKHKRFAEEKIQNYQRSIKDEQRRNFGDDFQEI